MSEMSRMRDLVALRVRTTQHVTEITGDKSEGKHVLAMLSVERIENLAGVVQLKARMNLEKEKKQGRIYRQLYSRKSVCCLMS